MQRYIAFHPVLLMPYVYDAFRCRLTDSAIFFTQLETYGETDNGCHVCLLIRVGLVYLLAVKSVLLFVYSLLGDICIACYTKYLTIIIFVQIGTL